MQAQKGWETFLKVWTNDRDNSLEYQGLWYETKVFCLGDLAACVMK